MFSTGNSKVPTNRKERGQRPKSPVRFDRRPRSFPFGVTLEFSVENTTYYFKSAKRFDLRHEINI